MSKRYYTLSGVVYDDDIECLKELFEYSNHYVSIIHDKDDRDTHIHFICTFQQNISFEGAKRRIHSVGNSFVQPVENLPGMFAYLTHSTEKAVEDGKHEYQQSELISDNIEYWYNRVAEKEEKKNNNEFINDLLAKDMSIREMGIKYGRDFIKNMHSYLAFRRAVYQMEPDIIEESIKHTPHYTKAENSPGWVTLPKDKELEI